MQEADRAERKLEKVEKQANETRRAVDRAKTAQASGGGATAGGGIGGVTTGAALEGARAKVVAARRRRIGAEELLQGRGGAQGLKSGAGASRFALNSEGLKLGSGMRIGKGGLTMEMGAMATRIAGPLLAARTISNGLAFGSNAAGDFSQTLERTGSFGEAALAGAAGLGNVAKESARRLIDGVDNFFRLTEIGDNIKRALFPSSTQFLTLQERKDKAAAEAAEQKAEDDILAANAALVGAGVVGGWELPAATERALNDRVRYARVNLESALARQRAAAREELEENERFAR